MASLMRMSAGNTAARVCAGLLVMALHLVVLLLILTSARKRPELSADSRALTLVDVEPSKPTVPAVPPMDPAREPNMRMPRLIDLPRPNIPSNSDRAPTTDAAPARDWRGSMEAAATAAVDAAIRNKSYEPLGPIEREPAGSMSAPSVFETPRHKAGDIDHDVTQGRTVIWHNDNCYTELRFPTIKDQNALVGAPNPPKCVLPFGKRKARGDLFEAMGKP
jgi:hypothetical protein